jgi:hypothetical protein
MQEKFYKFHFKNDETNKASSYDVNFNNFTEALDYAYNKLDQLNSRDSGYRIIGVYEILGYKKCSEVSALTN